MSNTNKWGKFRVFFTLDYRPHEINSFIDTSAHNEDDAIFWFMKTWKRKKVPYNVRAELLKWIED